MSIDIVFSVRGEAFGNAIQCSVVPAERGASEQSAARQGRIFSGNLLNGPQTPSRMFSEENILLQTETELNCSEFWVCISVTGPTDTQTDIFRSATFSSIVTLVGEVDCV
jgi:hypothetical protein